MGRQNRSVAHLGFLGRLARRIRYTRAHLLDGKPSTVALEIDLRPLSVTELMKHGMINRYGIGLLAEHVIGVLHSNRGTSRGQLNLTVMIICRRALGLLLIF